MKKYFIRKNSHYCKGIHFGISMESKFHIRCMFDDSCIYDLGDSDQYDINKLYGVSTSYYHHDCSARLGWRYIDGKIEIVSYTYDDKVRKQETVLGRVEPYEEFEAYIEITDTAYIYTFKQSSDIVTYTDTIKSSPFKMKYKLFPYFGGNKKSPHDMFLYIDELN